MALAEITRRSDMAVDDLVAWIEGGGSVSAARVLRLLGKDACGVVPALINSIEESGAYYHERGLGWDVVPGDVYEDRLFDAACTLGDLATECPGVRASLARAVERPFAIVRYCALVAIERVKSPGPDLLHAVVGLMVDRVMEVRRQARSALVVLTERRPELSSHLLVYLSEEGDPRLRVGVMSALRGKAVVPVLIRALAEQDADVRLAAIDALEHQPGPARRALPALNRAMQDADERVRDSATRAVDLIRSH